MVARMPVEVVRQRDGDTDSSRERLARDVARGLGPGDRSLPCKYLYDDAGSRLFDEITRQPEYYQTRTEEAILERHAEEIVGAIDPTELVELGSGVGRKVRLLLDAMAARERLRRCTLIDINREFLTASLEELAGAYPGLEAVGLHGDFLGDLEILGPGGGRLVILLAGTVGNLHPDEVSAFLARVASLLEPGDGFLVGLDQVKDPARLEAAYNDAAGVTAAFNRNVLAVLNRELEADFDLAAFDHVARWDPEHEWIDIRLRSNRAQRVVIPGADLTLELLDGDEIRTEISAKYTEASWARRVVGTGLRPRAWFTDAEDLFALSLLERA